MRFRELKLRKNPDCPVCGEKPTIKELIDYEEFCGLRPKATEEEAAAGPAQITARELDAWIKRGDDIQIIDVREPHEFEIARIPGGRLIPLRQVTSRIAEIDAARTTVVQCKGGVRSAQAIAALQQAGFKGQLINLQGGILAWSNDVDPSAPKY